MNKYYITTPIYYINDIPHIGHAYTTIAADVLARYHREKGEDAFFLTGTDEHGAKISEAAKKAGKEPKVFVDDLVLKFKETWKNLNIDYSEFFRTTNPEHEKIVQEFVQKLKDKGFIEKRKYEGLYCVECEKFYSSEELEDGKCPDHGTVPKKHSEENYFFLLSKLQDRLIKVIESDQFKIEPESRKNEVLGKIKQDLEDVSISRQGVKWGIGFPSDESQTIYVWVDALLNYYTATKIFDKKDIWPADLHLIGKDILWFHAIIWPAMLLALDLPLPKKVFAHGFFTVDGKKMSKTLGNVLDPNELIKKYGVDTVRYALLREFPFGEDGDISEEKIKVRYVELANNIGNLLQRTLSMINKYQINIEKNSGSRIRSGMTLEVDKEIETLDFMGALKKIICFAENQNKYIAEWEPWALAKENKKEELEEVLQNVINGLIEIQKIITPFMPKTAEKMKSQLELLKPEPLFPKID